VVCGGGSFDQTTTDPGGKSNLFTAFVLAPHRGLGAARPDHAPPRPRPEHGPLAVDPWLEREPAPWHASIAPRAPDVRGQTRATVGGALAAPPGSTFARAHRVGLDAYACHHEPGLGAVGKRRANSRARAAQRSGPGSARRGRSCVYSSAERHDRREPHVTVGWSPSHFSLGLGAPRLTLCPAAGVRIFRIG
jgi:hypothetical protein